MDVHLRELAATQDDLVAAWQLMAVGWTAEMVKQRVRDHGWRSIHPGVYALTQSPLTQRQRWIAATLTAPGTFLSHASGGAAFGFRVPRRPLSCEIVTRRGNGGPRQLSGVLVLRSRTLGGDTTDHDGIPITTAARTLLDLAPHMSDKETGRAFREALRLGVTDATELVATLARHRRRRGSRLLCELTSRYAHLPYRRARSNPECRALEVLHDAGVEPPRLNLKVAGEEADLVWPARRLIIEIDGPDFHRYRDEDARKARKWRKAGFEVRRISSDDVYENPQLLVALATA